MSRWTPSHNLGGQVIIKRIIQHSCQNNAICKVDENNILKRSRTILEFRKVACLGLAYVPRFILLKSTILLHLSSSSISPQTQLSSQTSTHAKHTKEAYNKAPYHIQYHKSNIYLGRQTLLKQNTKIHIKVFSKQNSFWFFKKCGANTRPCILVK